MLRVDPATRQVVVTRSGYHFTLNYASVGETITVDTPGITSYHVEALPWTLARPFHPVDRVDFHPTAARHGRRHATAS